MSCFDSRIQRKFAEVDWSLTRDKMHAYQNTAVQFLLDNPFSALFIDMGLGKTIISLTTILELVGRFECETALVIAPLRVANETWPTEIVTWAHTAGLNFALIRDEELVDAVNAAGEDARRRLKICGMGDPDIRKFMCLIRTATARKHAKKMPQPERKPYIQKMIDAAGTKPINEKEAKAYQKYARGEAAKTAVRRHKEANPATVYIINREQVEFLVDAWGKDWPYDTVFVDESSSLKDHRTNRFKALQCVLQYIKRMHELTATPAAESYAHLFAQIYLLDRGERFGRNFSKFAEQYFTYNQYTRKYTIQEGADERIAKKISDICLTMKAEDYLEMKEPMFLVNRVHMAPEQRAQYDEMETHSVLELGDGSTVEAATAAALSSKLMQMASGVVYETRLVEDKLTGDFDKARIVHHLHDEKIEKLRQLKEEACGEPLLVSYHLKSSLERLKKAFPEAHALSRAGKEVKSWNAGKISMLLVHPQSGGHGLNLQRGGRRIVFFDLPWSLELYLQFIGRLHRQGQQHRVQIHHIITGGTIDEFILECLRNKEDAQEKLFLMLKALRGHKGSKKPKGKKFWIEPAHEKAENDFIEGVFEVLTDDEEL